MATRRKKAAAELAPVVLPAGRWQVVALHPLEPGRVRQQPARLRNAETWEEVSVAAGQTVVGIPDEALTGTSIYTITREEATTAAQSFGVAFVEDCSRGHCWHSEDGIEGEAPSLAVIRAAEHEDGLFHFGCCRCSVVEGLSSPWGRRSTHRRATR